MAVPRPKVVTYVSVFADMVDNNNYILHTLKTSCRKQESGTFSTHAEL